MHLSWTTEEYMEDVFKKVLKEAVSVASTMAGAPTLNLKIKMEPEDKFMSHPHSLLTVILIFLLFLLVHPSLKLLFPLSQLYMQLVKLCDQNKRKRKMIVLMM